MFQKFNFDTQWAVKLISKITNDEDMPIEGDAIVNQAWILSFILFFFFPFKIDVIVIIVCFGLWVILQNFQLLALQTNAEKFFFGIRKSLVEFDEVLEVCTSTKNCIVCSAWCNLIRSLYLFQVNILLRESVKEVPSIYIVSEQSTSTCPSWPSEILSYLKGLYAGESFPRACFFSWVRKDCCCLHVF